MKLSHTLTIISIIATASAAAIDTGAEIFKRQCAGLLAVCKTPTSETPCCKPYECRPAVSFNGKPQRNLRSERLIGKYPVAGLPSYSFMDGKG
ncbi:hypothetical protein HYFRA_00000056 [Hymenoscyphus fraxineus]|uniref:Uncharacterized protein n=1 Tax=Hymenoscyphus fraxineus TaxID=746836 RepID=A0A9N9L4T4_9HELO|nr:hypothetical protein HYFRA_00000056 [Hymenoscyphus fraxineus]